MALIVVLGLAEFALLWVYARKRTRRAGRTALGALLIAGVLLVVQTLVVTNRERITVICREMADAIEDGDVAAIGQHIAPDFDSGMIDRAALLDGLRGVLARIQIEEPRLSSFHITATGNDARAEFQAGCRLVSGDYVAGWVVSRWELSLHWADDRWQVNAIRPIPTPQVPCRSLGEALHAR